MKKLMILSVGICLMMSSYNANAASNIVEDGVFGAAFIFAKNWSKYVRAQEIQLEFNKDFKASNAKNVTNVSADIEEDDDLRVFSIIPSFIGSEAKYYQRFGRVINDLAYRYNAAYSLDLNPDNLFEDN